MLTNSSEMNFATIQSLYNYDGSNKQTDGDDSPMASSSNAVKKTGSAVPPYRSLCYFSYLSFLSGLRSESRTRTEVVTIFNRTKYLGRPVREPASDDQFVPRYTYVLFFCKQPPETDENVALEHISSITLLCSR